MSSDGKIDRRDFLAKSAGVAGSVGALAVATSQPAAAATPKPRDLDPESPIFKSWDGPLSEIAEVNLGEADSTLTNPIVIERHRIYSFLLMKLIQRFWNGNKKGPIGFYPQRLKQVETSFAAGSFRYRGDRGERVDNSDPLRITWDRYLGHNIACLAVDGNGEIIDFEFNHNDFFRSSAEHAESRLVRRIFSLADIFDGWRTGPQAPGKSRAASLTDVTIYTSLESCAQCSGVMSLGQVKEVVFLQHDPGAYRIGNIMYKLSGTNPTDRTLSLAPLPIPASALGLPYLTALDDSYKAFAAARIKAKTQSNKNGAFFVSVNGDADFAPSITSYLCTDDAFSIFSSGADAFERMTLSSPASTRPGKSDGWTNEQCFKHAQRFYQYADFEGFRGSPHKL